MKTQIDPQENQILDDFNKGEFVFDKDFDKNKKTYQKIALNTLKKNKKYKYQNFPRRTSCSLKKSFSKRSTLSKFNFLPYPSIPHWSD